MAGFGFSPSDIVEFGKFAYKVADALKEDGGSKSEFQEAIGWCEDFREVLKEIQNLELSNVSTSFADQLKEHSQRSVEFVARFRTKIAKYEKAMGENSAKGAHHGTARKIQWALEAANDLDKFCQSLHMSIKALEMFMASRMLANVDQIPSLRAQTTQVNNSVSNLQNSVIRISEQQNVARLHIQNIYEEIRFLRGVGNPNFVHKVMELTDTITQLLATRSGGTLLTGPPRVWTLPDAMEYASTANEQPFGRDEPQRQSPANPATRSEQGKGQEAELIPKKAVDDVQDDLQSSLTPLTGTPAWIRETNEVLRVLQLPEITAEEFGNYGKQAPSYPEIHEAEESQHSPPPGVETNSNEESRKVKDQVKSNGEKPKRGRYGWFQRNLNPLGVFSGIEVAGAVMGVAATVIQLSLTLSSISLAPKAIYLISARIQDLAPLLHDVAETLAVDNDLRMGRRVLDRAGDLLNEIEALVRSLMVRERSKVTAVATNLLRWQMKKEAVQHLLDELESLKLTLSCVLQAHQIKIQKQQYQIQLENMDQVTRLEETFRHISDVCSGVAAGRSWK